MAVDRGASRTSARLQLQPAAKIIVKPADAYDEETRFRRSSLWAKKELDMLGVRVQQTRLLDLNKIIGKVKPWSSEVQKSICHVSVSSNTVLDIDLAVEALSSVDTSSSGVLEEELEIIKIRWPLYYSFFKALHAVIESRERKDDRKPADITPITPTNREPPALDPRFSDSSNLSGTSSEGKPEEAPKALANQLLGRVLSVMDNDFRTIKWSEGPWISRITETYSPLPPRLFALVFREYSDL